MYMKNLISINGVVFLPFPWQRLMARLTFKKSMSSCYHVRYIICKGIHTKEIATGHFTFYLKQTVSTVASLTQRDCLHIA
jgi:hypothetical protein